MNGLLGGLLGSDIAGLGGISSFAQGQQQLNAMQGQMTATLQANWLANLPQQPLRQLTPDELAKEAARKDCALSMKNNWRVKVFMEKALPLDWCKRLYPEAYEI